MNMEYLHIERQSTEYLKDLMLYKEKAEKNIMLKLISGIKERLAEINDGNFVVEDLQTAIKKSVIVLNAIKGSPCRGSLFAVGNKHGGFNTVEKIKNFPL